MKTLFEESALVRNETIKFEKAVEELNSLNGFLNDHGIGPLTKSLAENFKKNPIEALRDIYKSKIPEVNIYTGLPNDKNRMLEQMHLPSAPEMGIFGYIRQVNLSVFDFGKKVTINDKRFQEYLDDFRFITDDLQLIEAYNDFEALGKFLGRINDKLHFIPLSGSNMPNRDYRLGDVLAFTSKGFEIQKTGFLIATQRVRR